MHTINFITINVTLTFLILMPRNATLSIYFLELNWLQSYNRGKKKRNRKRKFQIIDIFGRGILIRALYVIIQIITWNPQNLDSPSWTTRCYLLFHFTWLSWYESQKGKEDIIAIFQSSELMFIQVSWTRKYSKYGKELEAVFWLLAGDLLNYICLCFRLLVGDAERKQRGDDSRVCSSLNFEPKSSERRMTTSGF